MKCTPKSSAKPSSIGAMKTVMIVRWPTVSATNPRVQLRPTSRAVTMQIGCRTRRKKSTYSSAMPVSETSVATAVSFCALSISSLPSALVPVTPALRPGNSGANSAMAARTAAMESWSSLKPAAASSLALTMQNRKRRFSDTRKPSSSNDPWPPNSDAQGES